MLDTKDFLGGYFILIQYTDLSPSPLFSEAWILLCLSYLSSTPHL